MSNQVTNTIYGHGISQPTRCVMWVSAIGNIKTEFVLVDLMKGKNKTPEFAALNPSQTIPVFQEKDNATGKIFTIYESHSILFYLAEKYNLTSLYPSDLQTRALIHQYFNWHHQNTRKATTNLFRPYMFSGGDAAALEKGIKIMEPVFKIIEGWLNQHEYLINNQLTLADLSCYCELGQLEEMGVYDYSKFPKIQAWLKKVKQVPHYSEFVKSLLKMKALMSNKQNKL